MRYFEQITSVIFIFTLAAGFFWAIMKLEQSEQKEREEQRAACIASGGKYAQYQGHNAQPAKDYCIKGN